MNNIVSELIPTSGGSITVDAEITEDTVAIGSRDESDDLVHEVCLNQDQLDKLISSLEKARRVLIERNRL
jgi:hypothetical protein